ncbi:hypothetical protein [Acinetobacter baumannii]|uniref:hypothetical protein n=1 Tax=Acinetobacter baumannii TaxID=470 RepID=UPI000BFA6C49|nr:hypothetical protein [Acinetobacter baumannii]
MTTMFIDTNGEMSFVDNERLKFIMHYLKQGADDSLVEIKDGRFVREDSELSFTEIWLPAAEHQQTKIDEQQAKVEELQKRVDVLTQTMEELLDEMKYPTATFEEVIVCGVKMLEQTLKVAKN